MTDTRREPLGAAEEIWRYLCEWDDPRSSEDIVAVFPEMDIEAKMKGMQTLLEKGIAKLVPGGWALRE